MNRKKKKWDCREGVVGEVVQQVESRRRLRKKTGKESHLWRPCPCAQQLDAGQKDEESAADGSPTVAEATSDMLRKQSKVALDDWRMKADATHKLCGFGQVVLCIRCGTHGTDNGRMGALAKGCRHLCCGFRRR